MSLSFFGRKMSDEEACEREELWLKTVNACLYWFSDLIEETKEKRGTIEDLRKVIQECINASHRSIGLTFHKSLIFELEAYEIPAKHFLENILKQKEQTTTVNNP